LLRTPQHPRHRGRWLTLAASVFVIGWLTPGIHWNTPASVEAVQSPTLTPTLDRLATPVLPPSPQPRDFGQQVYYLNCMPCHGDVGQGLTDEWRAVWEEDHQDCWASGCHGGRVDDEGFPVPHTIPAVIGVSPILEKFHTTEELYDYLRLTHPPQQPGVLSDTDYHNVTALLWEASGRPTLEPTQAAPDTVQPAPTVTQPAPEIVQPVPALDLPIVGGALMLVALIFVVIRQRRAA
jgi:hypothetical protein